MMKTRTLMIMGLLAGTVAVVGCVSRQLNSDTKGL